MSKSPSLIVNALSNWVSLFINGVIGLILTPVLIKYLGTDGYGIWILVFSIVGYYGLLDVGIQSAVLRYIAIYIGKKDIHSLNNAFNSAVLLYSVIGILVFILSIILSGLLSDMFKVPLEKIWDFKYMILLIGMATGIGMTRRVFTALFLAYERFVLVNTIGIIFALVRVITLYSVLIIGGGLFEIALVELIIELTNLIINIYLSYLMRHHGIKLEISLANRQMVILLFNFGFFTFITIIGDTFRFTVDSIIIGKYIGVEAVAVYAIAMTVIRLLERFTHANNYVTAPRLSRLAGIDLNVFNEHYLLYSRWSAIVVSGITTVAILLYSNFVLLWVGPKFDGSVIIFIILSFSLLTDLVINVSTYALRAVNKHKYYAIQTIIEGIAYLICKLILVRYYGILGIAIGTAIPLVIAKLLIQPIYTCRILKIDMFQYYVGTIIKPIGACAFLVITIHLFGYPGITDTYIVLFSQASVISFLYLVIIYFLCITHDERIKLTSGLLKVKARLSLALKN